MKKFKTILILTIFTLLNIGCVPIPSDYSIELPDGYILSKANSRSIAICREDEDGFYSYTVGTKVLELAWNNEYILAKRLPLDLEFMGKFSTWDEGEEYINSFTEEDMEYWIIDVYNNKFYRLLTKERFMDKRLELGVPEELELKKVDYYEDSKRYSGEESSKELDNADNKSTEKREIVLKDCKDVLEIKGESDIYRADIAGNEYTGYDYALINNGEESITNVIYRYTFYKDGMIIYQEDINLENDIILPGDPMHFRASTSHIADDIKFEILRGEG